MLGAWILESVIGGIILIHSARLLVDGIGGSGGWYGIYSAKTGRLLGSGSRACLSANALLTFSSSCKISAITLFIAETGTFSLLIRCANPFPGSRRISLISLKTLGSE